MRAAISYSHTQGSVTGVSNTWVHGCMLITVILVAGSFPVGALIADALPSSVLMMIRFFLAALLFLPVVVYVDGFRVPSPSYLFRYALLSVPLVVFFWCMFEALRYTSAINTGALYTVVPALTALFSFLINGDAVSKKKLSGLLLGTFGALWIVFKGDATAVLALTLNYGDWVFFIGAIALSTYSPLVKKNYREESMAVMTFWVMVCAGVWMLLLSHEHLAEVKFTDVGLSTYAGIAYLALFTTLISFFVLQCSTMRIGPTKTLAYSFLNPIFVLFVSVAIGMGRFEGYMLPGVVLVILGMLFILQD